MIRQVVGLLVLLPSLAWAQWSGNWGEDIENGGGRTSQQQMGLAREFTMQVTSAQFGILRNEAFQSGVARIGGTFTYDFAQFVPTDFATSPLFIETAQFLPDGQWNGPQAGFGPVLAVGIRNGRWELHNSHMAGGREVPRMINLGTVERNRWVPFRVEVRWSPNNDGWVRVYKDGRMVLQRTGPTTFSQETPYFKTGLYTRRVWTQGNGSAPLDQFRILHAALTVRQGAGGAPVQPPDVTPRPGPGQGTGAPPLPGDPEPPPQGPAPPRPGGDVPPAEPTLPEAPDIPPIVIPETPDMPRLPPPVRPPVVVVRPPQTPPAYTGGMGGG